jgi:hypothetical protein
MVSPVGSTLAVATTPRAVATSIHGDQLPVDDDDSDQLPVDDDDQRPMDDDDGDQLPVGNDNGEQLPDDGVEAMASRYPGTTRASRRRRPDIQER